MKPNKVFLIIASVFLTFGLILGGIYIYVSKTLTPENIRVLISQSLQVTFPQAQITVVDVDFKFGTSIEFIINKIDIKADMPLASLSDAKLKIPVWSILKGGGVVELEVNRPQFFWMKGPGSTSNWSNAMQGQVKTKKGGPSDIILPAFLISSRVNIKMKDSIVKYQLAPNEKGQFLISKFLIKEIGLESPAAFEIDTSFVFQQEELGEISANILLIGEADLHRYLSDGKLSLISVVTVSKISNPGITSLSIPDIRLELKSELSKAGTFSTELKGNFLESQISLKLDHNQKVSELTNIKADLLVQDLLSISGARINNLSSGKAVLNVSGKLSLSDKSYIPHLKFNLSSGLNYSYNGLVLQPSLLGSLDKAELNLKAETPLLQGNFSSDISAKVPLEFKVDYKNFPELKINSVATGINITPNDLSRFKENTSKIKDESSNQNTAEGTSTDTAIVKEEKLPLILPINLQLSVIESRFNSKDFTLSSNLIITSTGIIKNQLSITIEKGKVLSKLNAKYDKELEGKSNLSFSNFPGDFINPFIPEGQLALGGALSGEIVTNFKRSLSELSYDSTFKLKLNEGKLGKIQMNSWIPSIAKEIKSYVPKVSENIGSIKLEPDFSYLEISGTATNKSINFKKIYFKAIEDKFEIDAKGVISLIDSQRSEIFADYKDYDGNLSSFLNKEVGTEVLPLKLVGLGLDIKPDVSYTTKRLSKIFLKKKGTSKIKDIAKKLLKDSDKNKLDKILKGILK